ncbi:MAG: hypothetical protein ABIE70_12390 [bacterium]
MEVSWDLILDVGLNAVGYLAAGALGILVYAMFSDRRRQPKSAATLKPVTITVDANATTAARTTRPVQFLNLSNVPRSHYQAPSTDRPLLDLVQGAAKNRGQVINTARQVTRAGVSSDRIRTFLPVTDPDLTGLDTGQ